MTKNQQPLRLLPVRYKGTANFKFVEGQDFLDKDIESMGGRSEAEFLIASGCPEIDTFTITDADYDGEFLSASARVSGFLLVSVPWHPSDALRPDQIKFLEARVVSYLSGGVDCMQGLNVSVKTQSRQTTAAT